MKYRTLSHRMLKFAFISKPTISRLKQLAILQLHLFKLLFRKLGFIFLEPILHVKKFASIPILAPPFLKVVTFLLYFPYWQTSYVRTHRHSPVIPLLKRPES